MATKGSELYPRKKIGELTLLMRVRTATTGSFNLRKKWRCECSCGNRVTVPEQYLVRVPPKQNCNARIHTETFNSKNKQERGIWLMMHVRCEDPSHVGYIHYGGRGIKVCLRWHKTNTSGFANFMEDMKSRPSKGHTLDRIDSDGNYEPSNCRWATWTEQNNNKRVHKV